MNSRKRGPQTERGKAVVRHNAVRHALSAESPVIPGNSESARGWNAHLNAVIHGFGAEGYVEMLLAERIASLTWRLRRVLRFEREVTQARLEKIPGDMIFGAKLMREELGPTPTDDQWVRLGELMAQRILPTADELNKITRYESQLHRHLVQTMHELQAMQDRRRGKDAPLARLDITLDDAP